MLPVCQLHWSNFTQPDPKAEQGGGEQEPLLALPSGSEPEGTSEQQGTSSQQKGVSEHQGVSGQQGISEQEGASGQQESPPHWRALLEDWMEAHELTMDCDCFVIKPADESQGAGVLLVNDFESVELHAWRIFQQVVD